MVYLPMEDGTVKLAWVVSIYELNAQHYWNIAIDAANGNVLKTEDQVIHDVCQGTPIVTDAPKSGTTPALASSAASKEENMVPYMINVNPALERQAMLRPANQWKHPSYNRLSAHALNHTQVFR